eukprot:g23336.t1
MNGMGEPFSAAAPEESADNSCSVSTVSEEELENLVMRSSWSMPWDKSFRMHHGRKIRVSRTEQSPMAMHMKDKVKDGDGSLLQHEVPDLWLGKLASFQDGSCLGRFVFGPYSMFPLLWSVVGCALILWDLVTIPLEMFNNIPQFIASRPTRRSLDHAIASREMSTAY